MKTTFFAGLMLGFCSGLAAQTAPANNETTELLDKRRRVAEQRETIEATFLTKQQECSVRFAVSDCLIQARRQRRLALDELRHQEIRLNDLDRQSKAAATLDRIQKNQSLERQRELELQRQQALQSAQERQLRSEDKKSQGSKPSATQVSGTRPGKSALSLEETSIAQQRYADKLHEAEQHKADKLRNLKESGAAPANALPVPTGR